MIIVSCGLFESNEQGGGFADKVYIALQNLDQVGIMDIGTETIQVINCEGEYPHFIVVDEINGYWFVTTSTSGYVERYRLDTDTLIDKLYLGDFPALMVLNEINKKLYVSRMMPMPGTESSTKIIHEIDYADPAQMTISHEYELDSPDPHGIAINTDGSEVYSVSNTADWLYKIIPEADSPIESVVMDPTSPNSEASNLQVFRLNPLQCLYVSDNLLLIACNGGSYSNWYSGEYEDIHGQVQLWNTTSPMALIDSIHFSSDSKPWHIINSPNQNHVFVTLAGKSGQGSGVVCLSYENNELNIIWDNYYEEFHTLHGIDISEDGSTVYVSDRLDDNLHILRSDNGQIVKSIPLSDNAGAGGIRVVHY